MVATMVAVALAVTAGQRLRRMPAGQSGEVAVPTVSLAINRATPAELTLLPGIGPALAGRIVDDREMHGSFASVEDLERVPGIGPATVRWIAPFVVARESPGRGEPGWMSDEP